MSSIWVRCALIVSSGSRNASQSLGRLKPRGPIKARHRRQRSLELRIGGISFGRPRAGICVMPQPLATLGDRASSAMRSPQNLWIAGLTRGHDEVGILRMPFDPAPDVRAERPYAQTAGPGVVEGVPCDGAGYPLTLMFLSHDSVEEHDGVGRGAHIERRQRALRQRRAS